MSTVLDRLHYHGEGILSNSLVQGGVGGSSTVASTGGLMGLLQLCRRVG